MKLKSYSRAVFGLISCTVPIVRAQTVCNAANAYVITDQTTGGSDGDPTGCNGDPACLATIEQGADFLSGSTLDAIGGLSARSLNVRQNGLSCTAAENCFSYNSVYLCVDLNTGLFHDSTGGYGSLMTGQYTAGTNQGSGATVASAGTSTYIGSSTTSMATRSGTQSTTGQIWTAATRELTVRSSELGGSAMWNSE